MRMAFPSSGGRWCFSSCHTITSFLLGYRFILWLIFHEYIIVITIINIWCYWWVAFGFLWLSLCLHLNQHVIHRINLIYRHYCLFLLLTFWVMFLFCFHYIFFFIQVTFFSFRPILFLAYFFKLQLSHLLSIVSWNALWVCLDIIINEHLYPKYLIELTTNREWFEMKEVAIFWPINGKIRANIARHSLTRNTPGSRWRGESKPTQAS